MSTTQTDSLSAPCLPRVGAGVRVTRTLLSGIFMTALVAVSLVVHHSAILFYRERLIDAGFKSLGWLLEQFGYALPFVILCVFPALVYRASDRRDGVARWEMFWAVVIVAILTYAVFLPCVARYSGILYDRAVAAEVEIEMTAGKVPLTLLMRVYEWFVRLLIPIAILLVFHASRAMRERRCPDEEEPVEYITPSPDGDAADASAADASDADVTDAVDEPAADASEIDPDGADTVEYEPENSRTEEAAYAQDNEQ